MEHASGAPSKSTPSAMAIQQLRTVGETYKAPSGFNDRGPATTAHHPFGAIGEEVKKAASHASSASTCSSDDVGGVSLHVESRERASSLRELVQQSTPMEPIAFTVPASRFNDTPSRYQQMSPTKPQQGTFEATLRSPPWIMHPAPESGEYYFEPLPPQPVSPHNAGHYAMMPSSTMQVHPELHFQHFQPVGNDNANVHPKQDPVPQRVQFPPPQVPAAAPNSSPERNIMGYRELVNGITKDLETICREYVVISISTNTGDSDNDLKFLDLVVAHMGSRDAAAYILKRTDLHVALVIGLIWRQVSTYILSKPVLDKAPSRSAAAFYHAYLDETFAHAYHADDLTARQTYVERRSSFVADIQRAPEYQAFVKTFATQVANDIVRDLMPVWRVGFTYKVSQVLIEKVTTRLVRLVSRMRAEAKVFHFDFYGFGTQFNSASMSKRNPDLLLEHGNDGTYAVMCDIAPAVFEMDLTAGQLDTKPVYLAEVLVYDKSRHIDEALDQIKLYGPPPMPPFGGRRRSRRKTGTAPPFDRRDSTTM